MITLNVGLGERAYPIHIGAGVLEQLPEVLAGARPTRVLVVTNTTVGPLYGAAVQALGAAVAPTALVALPDGEQYKDWPGIAAVLEALVALGADRRSLILALGGGVVGDMAGFAAAIYMRGIRFVQLPTTLLAQVDSSVGGKTGINLAAGKNLVGAFHQPIAVLADTATLTTLPARELSAGLAEVLKHGVLADADYFAQTEAALERLRAFEPVTLAAAVEGSCRIKSAIVARDERESGERALLNLGHTFGHAIETLAGYGNWLHGEAVGCGLCLAADLSRRLGMIGADEVGRIEDAVTRAGLPTRIGGLGLEAAIAAMRGDKKAEAGEIRFVLLERIGRAVQRSVPDEVLRATLNAGGYR